MTTRRSQPVNFKNENGNTLSAVLDQPLKEPRAYAIFAHCFTCNKANTAAVRISRALSAHGVAVLRFDFTGLGASEGDFAETNFSSNVADLVAAAEHLTREFKAPSLLIGHSLGGAAALAAAGAMPSLKAVATINAPFDPGHVTQLFGTQEKAILNHGEAEVSIAGRPFRVRKHFLDDISQAKLGPALVALDKALLVLHAPVDKVVGIDNARLIFEKANHPKSFISLDDADHLLSRSTDSEYVATTLSAWAARYLPEEPIEADPGEGTVSVQSLSTARFAQQIQSGRLSWAADEPKQMGGDGSGPSPYDLLLSALGACTSMTCRMYADRKKMALTGVTVKLRHSKIHAKDCADCDSQSGLVDVIEREILLEGSLSLLEREQLMSIADKCPVHRTLHSEVKVVTRELTAKTSEAN